VLHLKNGAVLCLLPAGLLPPTLLNAAPASSPCQQTPCPRCMTSEARHLSTAACNLVSMQSTHGKMHACFNGSVAIAVIKLIHCVLQVS
jgi:hypothetical protein